MAGGRHGTASSGRRGPLGRGAVIAAVLDALGPDVASPEAAAAAAAWRSVTDPRAALLACASGRELVGRGLGDDVELAAEVDVGRTVPMLVDGAFRSASGGVGELGA